jgi:hypothetical protein
MAKQLILFICFILIALAACTGMASNPTPDFFAIQTEGARMVALGTDPFSMTATSIVATATAFAPYQHETSTSIIQTATAFAPYGYETATAFAPIANQTSTVVAAERATYSAMATAGTDVFDMTATSIIASATASVLIATYQAQGTPIGCMYTDIERVDFYYSETIAADWLQNPNIHEYGRWEYLCYETGEFYERHQIIIRALDELESADLYLILENAISRLPGYPPFEEATAMVVIINIEDTAEEYGRFSYSEALNAYEAGLRGADLVESLGLIQP